MPKSTSYKPKFRGRPRRKGIKKYKRQSFPRYIHVAPKAMSYKLDYNYAFNLSNLGTGLLDPAGGIARVRLNISAFKDIMDQGPYSVSNYILNGDGTVPAGANARWDYSVMTVGTALPEGAAHISTTFARGYSVGAKIRASYVNNKVNTSVNLCLRGTGSVDPFAWVDYRSPSNWAALATSKWSYEKSTSGPSGSNNQVWFSKYFDCALIQGESKKDFVGHDRVRFNINQNLLTDVPEDSTWVYLFVRGIDNDTGALTLLEGKLNLSATVYYRFLEPRYTII